MKLNRQVQTLAWSLVWIVFTLVIGLRHEVGGDWGPYLRHFNAMQYFSFSDAVARGDPGYYVLNWIVDRLGGSIYWVNLICGGIVMAGVMRFAKDQPSPWLALAVAVPYLIIVVAMGYSRQAVALGFLMIGLVSLSKGQTKWFVFWVVLGASFHKSAVLMLPVAALASTTSRIWSILWVGVITLIAGYLFIFDSADRLWENYVEADYQSEGGLIRVLMNAVPALLFVFLKNHLQLAHTQRRLWLMMSLFALACIPLVVLSSTATDRVALYLMPLQLFLFARIYLVSDSPIWRSVIVLGVLFYYALVQLVWLTLANNAEAWLPYQMVWFSSGVGS